MAKPQSERLVVCVENDGYPASLEKRKIYIALRDASAERHGLLRIVDESGDDYLYPKTCTKRLPMSPVPPVTNAPLILSFPIRPLPKSLE
jgi:hypothetical protein